MKNESESCTIVRNSFISQNHYLFKIPDPNSNYTNTIKRPFDLFGRYEEKPIYIEMKYLSKLESFNLNRIENHQFEALLEHKKIKDAICLIGLSINVSRTDKRIYFWDINYIYNRFLSKKNILKKELINIPFYTIKKGLIQEKLIF